MLPVLMPSAVIQGIDPVLSAVLIYTPSDIISGAHYMYVVVIVDLTISDHQPADMYAIRIVCGIQRYRADS